MKISPHRSAASGLARFSWRDPENWLLVQQTITDGVLIYAAQDHLTPEQRESFIRYLQAEGFVMANPSVTDRFGECALSQESVPVRWMIDPSRSKTDPSYALHIRRLSFCTLGIAVVWLAFMIVLVRW